jgi:hypothetical protein
VPFYRDRLGSLGGSSDGELTMERWRRLPPLTRRDVQEAGRRLHSTAAPKADGGFGTVRTSGSSGTLVEAVRTNLAQFYRAAVGLRFVLWHDLDVAADVAVLCRDRDPGADPEHGRSLPDWGAPCVLAFATGSLALMDVRVPIAEQVDRLPRRPPGYLITLPSNLSLLARHCVDHAIRLPTLRLIRIVGEVVTDDLRAL